MPRRTSSGYTSAALAITATLNGLPATFQEFPPAAGYPNGSLEVDPCPESGGVFELTWSLCQP